MQILDCIIIGAGQCGLFAAKTLQDRDLTHLVLEKETIGHVWQNRLEGMTLFTSRQFCSLPGLPFPGNQGDFPSVTEMANYLKEYANTFKLSVKENTEVTRLGKEGDDFIVTLKTGEHIHAKTVINATGSNQIPLIPSMSMKLSKAIQQFDCKSLTHLGLVPPNSKVAVIGDGATGRQIAGGLAAAQHESVILATGTPRGLPPNRILGKDLFWWLKKLGILFADKHSLVAKILQKRNPVPCGDVNNRKLTQKGVHIFGKAVRCEGNTLHFADGQSAEVDVVIWAVGYRDQTNWLDLPHCVNADGFVQNYGITPESGLYAVGRKWLSCRASELVMGVEQDVNHVMQDIERYLSVSK